VLQSREGDEISQRRGAQGKVEIRGTARNREKDKGKGDKEGARMRQSTEQEAGGRRIVSDRERVGSAMQPRGEMIMRKSDGGNQDAHCQGRRVETSAGHKKGRCIQGFSDGEVDWPLSRARPGDRS